MSSAAGYNYVSSPVYELQEGFYLRLEALQLIPLDVTLVHRMYSQATPSHESPASYVYSTLFIRSEVSVDDVRQAIQSVDPEAPAEVVDKYLGRAFNAAADQLETGTKIETTLLIKKLQSGSVRRLGPKPK